MPELGSVGRMEFERWSAEIRRTLGGRKYREFVIFEVDHVMGSLARNRSVVSCLRKEHTRWSGRVCNGDKTSLECRIHGLLQEAIKSWNKYEAEIKHAYWAERVSRKKALRTMALFVEFIDRYVEVIGLVEECYLAELEVIKEMIADRDKIIH